MIHKVFYFPDNDINRMVLDLPVENVEGNKVKVLISKDWLEKQLSKLGGKKEDWLRFMDCEPAGDNYYACTIAFRRKDGIVIVNSVTVGIYERYMSEVFKVMGVSFKYML